MGTTTFRTVKIDSYKNTKYATVAGKQIPYNKIQVTLVYGPEWFSHKNLFYTFYKPCQDGSLMIRTTLTSGAKNYQKTWLTMLSPSGEKQTIKGWYNSCKRMNTYFKEHLVSA